MKVIENVLMSECDAVGATECEALELAKDDEDHGVTKVILCSIYSRVASMVRNRGLVFSKKTFDSMKYTHLEECNRIKASLKNALRAIDRWGGKSEVVSRERVCKTIL